MPTLENSVYSTTSKFNQKYSPTPKLFLFHGLGDTSGNTGPVVLKVIYAARSPQKCFFQNTHSQNLYQTTGFQPQNFGSGSPQGRGGYWAVCWMSSSISGLDPPGEAPPPASPPSSVTARNGTRYCQVLLGGKIAPGWEPLSWFCQMRISGCQAQYFFFLKSPQVVLLQSISGPTLGTSGLEIKTSWFHNKIPLSLAFLCKALIYLTEKLTPPD